MLRLRLAIVGSLRFPGGTSTAIADELPVLESLGDVVFYDADVKMLRQCPKNDALVRSLRLHQVPVAPASGIVAADVVIVHNPALFKYEDSLDLRLVGRRVFVVMHENPVTAFCSPTYQCERVLGMLRAASVTPGFFLAPISRVSRQSIANAGLSFPVTQTDWRNVWSGEFRAPVQRPLDRRGRHSRPGPEKWPKPDDLDLCFPRHAVNHILGAPPWLTEATNTAPSTFHYPFGSMDVGGFLERVDFFVYFHSEGWRESFGRCIAEAIAAGKLVITHPYLEQTFGKGCVYATPAEVDRIIAFYLDRPAEYVAKVGRAQRDLARNNGPARVAEDLRAMVLA